MEETKTLDFKERLERAQEITGQQGFLDFSLVGVDGNAFSIMGHFQKHAKRAGWEKEAIEEILDLARQGNYDQLLTIITSTAE